MQLEDLARKDTAKKAGALFDIFKPLTDDFSKYSADIKAGIRSQEWVMDGKTYTTGQIADMYGIDLDSYIEKSVLTGVRYNVGKLMDVAYRIHKSIDDLVDFKGMDKAAGIGAKVLASPFKLLEDLLYIDVLVLLGYPIGAYTSKGYVQGVKDFNYDTMGTYLGDIGAGIIIDRLPKDWNLGWLAHEQNPLPRAVDTIVKNAAPQVTNWVMEQVGRQEGIYPKGAAEGQLKPYMH